MTLDALDETKASLFNLIFYTQESRRLPYFKELIREMSGLFPSRIIFTLGEPTASPPFLRTSISTSVPKRGSHAITCEEISIEAGGADLAKVPFFMIPQLIPDLPVYLLWGHDPTMEHEILPHVQKYATRLIFDSDCTESLPSFSRKMTKEYKKWPCEIVDMSWARITRWRRVLAQTFDAAERVEDLKSCVSVTITYNEAPSPAFTHPEIQAYYLQAWLATQLRWKWVEKKMDGKTMQFIYSVRRRHIEINLIPALSPQPSGVILSVDLHSQNNRSYHLACSEAVPQQVLVNISSESTCDLPFTMPLPSRSSGLSFIREILFLPQSKQYNDMLQTIGTYE